MEELIVYTCITNGKDTLKEYEPEEGIRYICFNDGSVEFKTNQWENFHIENEWNFVNPRLTARYCKMNPNKVLPEHIWSLWIDGSLFPKVRVKDLLEWAKSRKNNNYFVRNHPGWNCIYKEAQAIKHYGFDKEWIINEVVKKYRIEGFPENYGMHETGVLLRKDCEEVQQFDSKWWDEVCFGSIRDQMSFDYIRWKTGKHIEELNRNWFGMDPNMKFFGHKHER